MNMILDWLKISLLIVSFLQLFTVISFIVYLVLKSKKSETTTDNKEVKDDIKK